MLLSCAPAKTNAPDGSNRQPSSGLLCLCSWARCVCIGSNFGGGAGGPWIKFFRSSAFMPIFPFYSFNLFLLRPMDENPDDRQGHDPKGQSRPDQDHVRDK